jgi:hypothetical protein
MMDWLVRASRLITLAILLGWLAYTLVSWAMVWYPGDAGAYYDAAWRLAHGQDLYLAMDPEAHEVYRYAPWFAYAWLPLTALPRDVALHAFSLLMVACSAAAVWPLLRRERTWVTVAIAALVGQGLVETAIYGNVQPAVVALLVWTAQWRSFPIWVGVAASIKLVPMALTLVWLGRREWRPAAVAAAVFAILVAPILLFDLSGYVTDPGTGLASLYSQSPGLWLALALANSAIVVWLAARGSQWAWVAAALLMYFGPPRVVPAYLAFLLVAIELMERDDGGKSPLIPAPTSAPGSGSRAVQG